MPPSPRLGRRTVLAFLLYGVAGAALANAPTQSQRPVQKPSKAARRALPKLADIVESAKLGGSVSLVVAETATGAVLEALNPLERHPPASVAKALTTIYGLAKLGPDHRYYTRVLATGPLKDGVVQGDLVLVGGADPLLDSGALLDMAGQLKEAGLRGITGAFLVQGGRLPQIEQIDADQPEYVGYNPAVSGLNLNFNRVYLEWKRTGGSYSVTMDARTERVRPGVSFARTTVEDRKSPVFTYNSGPTSDRWTVARGALGTGGGRWLPVRHPDIYAGDVLQTVARSHGIELPYPTRITQAPAGETLVEHESPPLWIICRDMLKFSTNLTAEVVGLTASGADSLEGSAGAMSEWLAQTHDTENAALTDHSGLGDRSRISGCDMMKALVGAAPDKHLRALLKELAVRDRQGRPVQNGPIKVVAKTGTLNFVSGLAGYIETDDGRDLSFAMFMSNIDRRAVLTRAERERPSGARSWNGRAKTLQQKLLTRWATLPREES